jgi:hypothetical protein
MINDTKNLLAIAKTFLYSITLLIMFFLTNNHFGIVLIAYFYIFP